MSHCKDPYKPTSIMEIMSKFHDTLGLHTCAFLGMSFDQFLSNSKLEVNTGIDIKGYQDWFTMTSTFMCWIKPTFMRRPGRRDSFVVGYVQPTNLSDLDLKKLVISSSSFWTFFPKTVGRLVDVSNFPLLILLEAWQGPDLVLCLPQQRLCHARSQRHLVNTKLGGGFKHFSFSPLPGEMIQFELIFFRWVGSTTNYW